MTDKMDPCVASPDQTGQHGVAELWEVSEGDNSLMTVKQEEVACDPCSVLQTAHVEEMIHNPPPGSDTSCQRPPVRASPEGTDKVILNELSPM